MKKILLISLFMPLYLASQISLTGTGSSNKYTQNFNGFTPVSPATPNGWVFLETGSGANTAYMTGNGSNSSGDTYFFGTGSDWSFGGLLSGSVNPTVGASFINNTGGTITELVITYQGETWRVGTANRSDSKFFSYSTNASSLSTGNWTNVPSLDYTNNPQSSTANSSMLQSATISNTISGLNIANGQTFWIKWDDFNASGADDGMSIDDFEIYAVAPISCTPPTLTTATTTGLTEQCTDGTNQFTYYGDATNPSQFAIKKNGNTISATVDIIRNGSVIPSTSTSGTNKEHASYLMGSSWDVTTSSTITNPVTVRFYYAPADTLAAMTARDNAYNTLLATNPSTLAVKSNNVEWFKTVGVPYNTSWTSTIVGNQFPSSYLKLTPTYGTENMVNYVEFSGITSFSGGTGGYSFGEANSTGASALPVLWGQVWIDQSKSQLNWETLSELNSNYFEIEASDDAIHFITISEKITAKGISQAKEKYTYELGSLFNYYYRIKQFDKDGQFQYSKITYNPSVVKKEIPVNPIQISYDDLNKYVNLTFNNTSDRVQKIVISNISGQVFLNDNLEPNSSKTILTSELNLQDGMYFVNILGESHREKFMIKK